MAIKKKEIRDFVSREWLKGQILRNRFFEIDTKNIRITRRICTIKPKSPITENGTDQILLHELNNLITRGYKYFILNLETSGLIGSSDGVVVHIFTKLEKIGGTIKLCCLNDRTLNKVRLSKLDIVLQIFETQEEAIDSFRK